MLDYVGLVEYDTGIKWIVLLITIAPLLYIHTLNRRSGSEVNNSLQVGLVLLLVRAALDLGEGYDQLHALPIVGTGDPLHSLYKTLSGFLGLVVLTVGASVEAANHARQQQAFVKDKHLREAVLSLIDAGILVTDKVGRVVYVNSKGSDLLRRSDEGLGKGAIERDRSLMSQAQEPSLHAAQLVRLDSQTFQMTRHETPVGALGEQLTVQAWWDVSEWERGERLSQEFVSAVSHEFRTPLTSIKGYLELAFKDPSLSAKVLGYLEVVHANTERLIMVVEDLLDLSRIEAGAVRFDLQTYFIEPLVLEAIEYFERDIREKHIQITTEVPSQQLAVYSDRERLLQIIANLLSNACKYTPEGGRITVRAVDVEPMVLIHVEDTGIGIQETEKANIFTRFYRTTDARLLQIKGTGLGLAITKSLIEAVGGSIWFESTHGAGSTFSVAVPKGDPKGALHTSNADSLPKKAAL